MATSDPDTITIHPSADIPYSDNYPGTSNILPDIDGDTRTQPPQPIGHDGFDPVYDTTVRITGAIGAYGTGAWDGADIREGGNADLGSLQPTREDFLFDWISTTFFWTDEQFEDFFGARRRAVVIRFIRGSARQVKQYSNAHQGSIKPGYSNIGLTWISSKGNAKCTVAEIPFLLLTYYGLTANKCALILSYFSDPARDQPDVPSSISSGRMHHSPSPSPVPKVSFSDKTQPSALISANRLRMNALPSFGTSAETLIPQLHPISVQIEENRVSGAISDELANLLPAMSEAKPPTFATKTGILKARTVSLNPNPATESRPDVHEIGVNEYATLHEDTRRYGFDTGFLRKIVQDNLRLRPTESHRSQTLVNFLKKKTSKFIATTLERKMSDMRKKYSQLFSLAHRLDRREKSRKYVEAWVTQVGIDANLDEEEYRHLRAIIPTSWLRDAEREVLARHHATRQRDDFKKEVAAKLLENTINLIQSETSHLIVLSSQLNNFITSIQKAYFKEIFDELNALPEDADLIIEYFPEAADAVSTFTLTDNVQDINVMENGDILANTTTKRIMTKLRDMVALNIVLGGTVTGQIKNGIPEMMRLATDKVKCNTFRFLPASQQSWLLGKDEIDVFRIESDGVKMREGSALRKKEWSIILFVYQDVHNKLVRIQEQATETWERAYMAKALKEDERRKAAYIFPEVNSAKM